MSTELATPEAPAAPIVATPETAVPVAPVTPAPITDLPVDDRLSLSTEQRNSLLFGQHEKPAEEAAPAAPVEAAPGEVAPVEAAPPVPEAAAEPAPVDDDEAPGITKNFRLHTEDPAQSAFIKAYKAALAVNPKVNPADVARLVGLDSVPGDAPSEIPGIPAEPQQPAELVAARAEIAAMEAQIDEAVEGGGLLTPELAKLQRECSRKQAALAKAELRHELAAERQAEAEQSQTQATRQSEMQAVEAEYPALSDPESDLSLELDRQFYAITGNPDHPDFQKVNAAGFPAYLTKQATDAVVARAMKKNPGMTEAQALAAVKGKPIAAAAPASPVVVQPAKPTQTQSVPRSVLVTSPGGKPAPAPVPLSIEQIRERAARDPEFRKAALGWSADRVVA